MPRFIVNRWAFILALVLAFSAIAGASHLASADGAGGILYLTEGGDGGGGGGGSVTIGDPDVPTGSTKGKVAHGALTQSTENSSVSLGGEHAGANAWMIRLRVVLQIMKVRWLGI